MQELAFALANAISLLDLLKERGKFDDEQFERAVGRISFFVNAGIRFIEEMCKMRAFGELWDSYTADRFGVKNEKYRRFRYGVQVNSLGLTEAQPENNAWRIILEALGVTLSRNARCRALQLPAWNEAMSLPRPWDQQWSLRLQQILAYETDLLEYPDLFDGSPVVESKVNALIEEATAEIETILGMGGVIPAIETGYMKTALVRSMSERMSEINSGEKIVVGLNKWTEGLPSPLTAGDDGGIFKVDEKAAEQIIASLEQVRATRDSARAEAAIEALKAAARDGSSLMEPSIECALARVTTGEWAGALREVFGEYRPHTGIEGQQLGLTGDRVDVLRERINALAESMGHRPRIVVGKPGLDGHSNGAEVIAVSARHVGFDVIYSGIRLSPDEIVQSAVEEGADLIGASVLSGSHIDLAKQILEGLREQGADEDIALVMGGIIPPADATELESMGIKRVFTPADYELMDIMEVVRGDPRSPMTLAETVERARGLNKHAVAKLVAMFEDTRASAAAQRAEVLELLDERQAAVIGITGTPGAGKSSLVARLVPQLLASDPDLSVAVLAVDPASHVSGGALLGDRTRTRFATGEKRAYFRSQSNAAELGGLAPTTFQVSRLLKRLFDVVLVETVGIGQSELDIRYLADHVYLVLQPLGGDEIQFLKAGIIEIPDSFILNKCDDPAAGMSYYQLRSSLSLARPFDEEQPPVYRTSARTGEGIDDLAAAMLKVTQQPARHTEDERERYFFNRWVEDEWGATGRRYADQAGTLLADGFDSAQAVFGPGIVRWLTGSLQTSVD